MAWWTGKSAISVLGWGDSNMLPAGGVTPSGGQVTTPGLYCYASASGQVPYSEANLGWRNLDPNGTYRLTEYFDSQGATPFTMPPFIGQLLGGCGDPSMQCGAALKTGTTIDTYVYHTAVGGTTADYWANGLGWAALERTIPTALAGIPGSPAAFDVILISMGGNDAIQAISEDVYLANMRTFRAKMIAEGWWVPGTTQVVFLDMPRSGPVAEIFAAFKGVDRFIASTNDRIAKTNSAGYELDPGFPVHYLPPNYTDAGNQAGKLALNQVSKRRAWAGSSGRTLSANGSRLLVHAA